MPQEAELLAKKAGESGMCEADYLRLLISQKPNDYPEVRKLLKELINEVNRIESISIRSYSITMQDFIPKRIKHSLLPICVN